MSAFSFEIATTSDDAALRDLIRRMPMPGPIRIAFEREPGFFDSQTVEGRFHETVVCRRSSDRTIVGMGCRSVKTVFLNGQPVPVGYLSSLRLLPAYRGARLVAGGYRYFHERHRDGLARLYLTTIVEDNTHALSILASGRPGLPAYHDFGRYYCAAIKVPEKNGKPPSSALNIRPATPADIVVLSEFLSREGAAKQFFPAYEPDDFRNSGGLLRSLKPSDIVLGFDGKTLVAAMSAWDQRAFRQTRIVGYNALVGAVRLPLNALARALGYPRLPAPGSCLNTVCLSLICVRRNDPELFSHMLDHLLARLCGHYDLLLAGFHETDPLLHSIRRRRHVSYTSRLFVVCWEDGESDIRRLEPHRIPYLELGSL